VDDPTIVIQSGYWWASPVAVLLSAALAAFGVNRSIHRQREIARTRATLDFILKSESDEFYRSIYRTFESENKRKNGLVSLLEAETESERRCLNDVLTFINHYELIAVSIENNILDEAFYKRWMRTSYVDTFDDCRDLICKLRDSEQRDSYFVSFERLANRWREKGDKKPSKA